MFLIKVQCLMLENGSLKKALLEVMGSNDVDIRILNHDSRGVLLS